jgi:hypothetical protein
MTLSVQIKKDKELSNKDIILMSKQRLKEYGTNKNEIKDFRKDYPNGNFFFVKDKKSVVAFGTMKPVFIKLLGKNYEIMGICNVISIKKKKGYGKFLMKMMQNFLKKNNKMGLGLCKYPTMKFYEKAGFLVKKDLARKFGYKYGDMKEEGIDGFYYNDKEDIIDKIDRSKTKVILDIPLW